MALETPPYFWMIVFCVALSALLLFYPLLSLARARRAARWPAVPATLLEARAVPLPGRATGGWCLTVRYAYDVNGTRYEGRRLAFGYVPGSDRPVVDALVQRLEGARALHVRADPRNPARATLSAGVPQSVWFVLTLGVTVAFFFAVMIAAMLVEDGLVSPALRPAVRVGGMLLVPVFPVALYVAFRTNRVMDRSVAEHIVTG